jgi:hypothetical protein
VSVLVDLSFDQQRITAAIQVELLSDLTTRGQDEQLGLAWHHRHSGHRQSPMSPASKLNLRSTDSVLVLGSAHAFDGYCSVSRIKNPKL